MDDIIKIVEEIAQEFGLAVDERGADYIIVSKDEAKVGVRLEGDSWTVDGDEKQAATLTAAIKKKIIERKNGKAAPIPVKYEKKNVIQKAAPVRDIGQLNYDQVRQLFCADADDLDIQKFVQVCMATGANPFLNRAYLMKPDPKAPATIVFSKYYFLNVAETNPQFNGYEAGIIVLSQGKVERREGTFHLPEDTLIGGWAKVYRKDREKPFVSEVVFDQVAKRKKDGQLTRFWREQPANMVRKVALVWALREAFSKQLGGLYEQDEIQADPSKEI